MNIENKKYFIHKRDVNKFTSMHHMIEILTHLINCTVQANVFQIDFAIIILFVYNNNSHCIDEYCLKKHNIWLKNMYLRLESIDVLCIIFIYIITLCKLIYLAKTLKIEIPS